MIGAMRPGVFRLPAMCVMLMVGGCAPRSGDRTAAAPPRDAAGPPVIAASAGDIRAMAARAGARATLVNVWATWCAPCREEFPALLRAAQARDRQGLRLVLVSADVPDQLPAVRRFLAAQGVNDTSYLKNGDDMAFIDAMDPRWSGALPATFVYDGRGRQTAFWEGIANQSRFTRSIDNALRSNDDLEDVRR